MSSWWILENPINVRSKKASSKCYKSLDEYLS